jgi:hypothetical protein
MSLIGDILSLRCLWDIQGTKILLNSQKKKKTKGGLKKEYSEIEARSQGKEKRVMNV